MADRLSTLEYDDVLGEAALEAAKARVKAYNQVNKELSPDAAEDMTKKYYKDFLSKLKKAYPYAIATRDDLSAIKNYDAGKMADYLYQYGIFNRNAPSPTEHDKAIKAADILPLLQGVAKPGADWMSMGNEQLKQFGLAHGYDVKTKEGLASLLKDIGEQQINYDRAKIAQEAKEDMGWSYWPRKVITPSAMQEFENAIMTGGDYDASTAAKMGALDALTNAASWEAPGLFIGKEAGAATKLMPEFVQRGLDKLPTVVTKPYGVKATESDFINGILNAAAQAGAEGARQGGEVALTENGQEADLAPILFAGTAGATRPALVGGIQQKAGQFQGPVARQFSRGFAKATRAGDAEALERAELKSTMDIYNKIVARVRNADEATKKATNGGHVVNTVNSDVYAQIAKANNIPEISKLFNVPLNKDFTIDAKKVLAQYDKPTVSHFEFTEAGKAVPSFRVTGSRPDARTGMRIVNGEAVEAPAGAAISSQDLLKGKFELDKYSDELYRRLFPQRYASVMAGTPRAYTAGVLSGAAASGLGGRIEPTFKLGADFVPKYEKTYKDESWYKNLSVRSKKIIDEAFKKKEAEESEEE